MNENACLPLSMRLGRKHTVNLFSTVHLLRAPEKVFQIFSKASKITEKAKSTMRTHIPIIVVRDLLVINCKLIALTK